MKGSKQSSKGKTQLKKVPLQKSFKKNNPQKKKIVRNHVKSNISNKNNENEDQMNEISFNKHKNELENLKNTDPEFYEYLKQNDENLLNFSGSEDDDANDDDEDNDEDLELEDEDMEDEIDDVDISEDESIHNNQPQTKEVTKELFDKSVNNAVNGSFKDLRKILSMFRAASAPLLEEFKPEDSDEEDHVESFSPYIISDPEVYQYVMTNSIEIIHKSISYQLNLKYPLNKAKIAEIGQNPKWKKLQNIVLSFFKIVFENLNVIGMHVKHHKITIFLLTSLENYIPFLAPLPRLTKTFLKVIINLWAGSVNDIEEEEAYMKVRGNSFLRIRQAARQLPGTITEDSFRAVYLKFARRCKTFNEGSVATIIYLANCIAELFKTDYTFAYQQAFLYIRQLALHLRSAYIKKGEAAMKSIKNWQYINCIRLWTMVITSMPKQEGGLGMLAYPLVQIIEGVIQLLPSPYYSPLRFHLISFIQLLAANCKLFIPTSYIASEILEYTELFNKPGPNTDVPPVLSVLLALPPNSLTKQPYRDSIVQECLSLIRMDIEIYRYTAGFPEYTYLLLRRLEKFSKKTKIGKWRDLARTIRGQIQQYSQFIKDERIKRSLTPLSIRDGDFEPLLPNESSPNVDNKPASERLADLLSSKSKLLTQSLNSLAKSRIEKKKREEQSKSKKNIDKHEEEMDQEEDDDAIDIEDDEDMDEEYEDYYDEVEDDEILKMKDEVKSFSFK